MTTKIIATILIVTIFSLANPWNAFGLTPPDPDSGSTSTPGRLICSGFWTKIICVVRTIANWIKSITKITKLLSLVPHGFPFGGHILTSEQACTLKFDLVTWVVNPACFILFDPTGISQTACRLFPSIPIGPVPITRNLGGRAIRVGTPVPIVPPTTSPYGRAIVFPWISDVYRNHSEGRVGPWALGLGFSPFPLKDLNDSLKSLRIWVPPLLYDPPCMVGGFRGPGKPYYGACVGNFRFECLDSGEFLPNGDPIYKVIRKLGTAP